MQRINDVDVLTTVEELVEPAQTAVLVIDMQNYLLSKEGEHARAGADISGLLAIVPRIRRLLKAAREVGVLVAYTEHIMQSKLGMNLMAGPLFYQLQRRRAKSVTFVVEDSWAADTIPELAPQTGDIVFPKTTSYGGSAMYHTLLDDVLRLRGIRSLVLTGALTEGCLLRTGLDTVQHGYYAVIVPDCAGSIERENHELALELIATRFPVFDSDEIVATWLGKYRSFSGDGVCKA